MATHVFTDIETGGIEPHHPIIQIGAVAVVDGVVRAEFERKIQFDPAVCDPKALELTGWSPERWMLAEPNAKVAADFAVFLKPYKTIEMVSKKTGKPYKVARIAGYNSAAFDMPRLLKFFKDMDQFLPAHPQSLDVMQLLFWYLEINPVDRPEDLKLGTVCKHFGIPLEGAHDALVDIRGTAQLAQVIADRMVDFLLNKFAPTSLWTNVEEIPF